MVVIHITLIKLNQFGFGVDRCKCYAYFLSFFPKRHARHVA
jgi:hypothetical protein